MISLIRKSQKGQTAVEYVMMVAVAVSLGIAVFKKLEDHLINNPNGLIGKPLNSYKQAMDQNGKYKRFPIRMAR
jgi:hypothetical protein